MKRLVETHHLVLRPFAPDDWRDVYAYMSDPEVVRYLPDEPHTEESSKTLVMGIVEARRHSCEWPEMLAVILKLENRLIGHMHFDVFSVKYRTREIGYVFNPAYYSRGFATEASLALLRFGFEQLKLHRIIATADPRNKASNRVLEKLGMRREAHFIKDVYLRDQWCDEYFYAMLEEEWVAMQGDSGKAC